MQQNRKATASHRENENETTHTIDLPHSTYYISHYLASLFKVVSSRWHTAG
jgi:hypothetical protein